MKRYTLPILLLIVMLPTLAVSYSSWMQLTLYTEALWFRLETDCQDSRPCGDPFIWFDSVLTQRIQAHERLKDVLCEYWREDEARLAEKLSRKGLALDVNQCQ